MSAVPRESKRLLGYTVAAMVFISVGASLATGTPENLPAAALQSGVVLHAERAAGLFAVLFLALLVLVRAFQGRLPEELSGRGLRYADRDAVDGLRTELLGSMREIQAAQEATSAAIVDLRARVQAAEQG